MIPSKLLLWGKFFISAIIIYPINPSILDASGYKIDSWDICDNKTGKHFIQCFEEITYSAKEVITQYTVGHGLDYKDDYYSTDYEDEILYWRITLMISVV